MVDYEIVLDIPATKSLGVHFGGTPSKQVVEVKEIFEQGFIERFNQELEYHRGLSLQKKKDAANYLVLENGKQKLFEASISQQPSKSGIESEGSSLDIVHTDNHATKKHYRERVQSPRDHQKKHDRAKDFHDSLDWSKIVLNNLPAHRGDAVSLQRRIPALKMEIGDELISVNYKDVRFMSNKHELVYHFSERPLLLRLRKSSRNVENGTGADTCVSSSTTAGTTKDVTLSSILLANKGESRPPLYVNKNHELSGYKHLEITAGTAMKGVELGFKLAELPPHPCLVDKKITPSSFADFHGVKVGDELLSINAQSVRTMKPDLLMKYLKSIRPITLIFEQNSLDPLELDERRKEWAHKRRNNNVMASMAFGIQKKHGSAAVNAITNGGQNHDSRPDITIAGRTSSSPFADSPSSPSSKFFTRVKKIPININVLSQRGAPGERGMDVSPTRKVSGNETASMTLGERASEGFHAGGNNATGTISANLVNNPMMSGNTMNTPRDPFTGSRLNTPRGANSNSPNKGGLGNKEFGGKTSINAKDLVAKARKFSASPKKNVSVVRPKAKSPTGSKDSTGTPQARKNEKKTPWQDHKSSVIPKMKFPKPSMQTSRSPASIESPNSAKSPASVQSRNASTSPNSRIPKADRGLLPKSDKLKRENSLKKNYYGSPKRVTTSKKLNSTTAVEIKTKDTTQAHSTKVDEKNRTDTAEGDAKAAGNKKPLQSMDGNELLSDSQLVELSVEVDYNGEHGIALSTVRNTMPPARNTNPRVLKPDDPVSDPMSASTIRKVVEENVEAIVFDALKAEKAEKRKQKHENHPVSESLIDTREKDIQFRHMDDHNSTSPYHGHRNETPAEGTHNSTSPYRGDRNETAVESFVWPSNQTAEIYREALTADDDDSAFVKHEQLLIEIPPQNSNPKGETFHPARRQVAQYCQSPTAKQLVSAGPILPQLQPISLTTSSFVPNPPAKQGVQPIVQDVKAVFSDLNLKPITIEPRAVSLERNKALVQRPTLLNLGLNESEAQSRSQETPSHKQETPSQTRHEDLYKEGRHDGRTYAERVRNDIQRALNGTESIHLTSKGDDSRSSRMNSDAGGLGSDTVKCTNRVLGTLRKDRWCQDIQSSSLADVHPSIPIENDIQDVLDIQWPVESSVEDLNCELKFPVDSVWTNSESMPTQTPTSEQRIQPDERITPITPRILDQADSQFAIPKIPNQEVATTTQSVQQGIVPQESQERFRSPQGGMNGTTGNPNVFSLLDNRQKPPSGNKSPSLNFLNVGLPKIGVPGLMGGANMGNDSMRNHVPGTGSVNTGIPNTLAAKDNHDRRVLDHEFSFISDGRTTYRYPEPSSASELDLNGDYGRESAGNVVDYESLIHNQSPTHNKNIKEGYHLQGQPQTRTRNSAGGVQMSPRGTTSLLPSSPTARLSSPFFDMRSNSHHDSDGLNLSDGMEHTDLLDTENSTIKNTRDGSEMDGMEGSHRGMDGSHRGMDGSHRMENSNNSVLNNPVSKKAVSPDKLATDKLENSNSHDKQDMSESANYGLGSKSVGKNDNGALQNKVRLGAENETKDGNGAEDISKRRDFHNPFAKRKSFRKSISRSLASIQMHKQKTGDVEASSSKDSFSDTDSKDKDSDKSEVDDDFVREAQDVVETNSAPVGNKRQMSGSPSRHSNRGQSPTCSPSDKDPDVLSACEPFFCRVGTRTQHFLFVGSRAIAMDPKEGGIHSSTKISKLAAKNPNTPLICASGCFLDCLYDPKQIYYDYGNNTGNGMADIASEMNYLYNTFKTYPTMAKVKETNERFSVRANRNSGIDSTSDDFKLPRYDPRNCYRNQHSVKDINPCSDLGFRMAFPPSVPRVLDVMDGSWASKAKIKMGSILISVQNKPVGNFSRMDLLKTLEHQRPLALRFLKVSHTHRHLGGVAKYQDGGSSMVGGPHVGVGVPAVGVSAGPPSVSSKAEQTRLACLKKGIAVKDMEPHEIMKLQDLRDKHEQHRSEKKQHEKMIANVSGINTAIAKNVVEKHTNPNKRNEEDLSGKLGKNGKPGGRDGGGSKSCSTPKDTDFKPKVTKFGLGSLHIGSRTSGMGRATRVGGMAGLLDTDKDGTTSNLSRTASMDLAKKDSRASFMSASMTPGRFSRRRFTSVSPIRRSSQTRDRKSFFGARSLSPVGAAVGLSQAAERSTIRASRGTIAGMPGRPGNSVSASQAEPLDFLPYTSMHSLPSHLASTMVFGENKVVFPSGDANGRKDPTTGDTMPNVTVGTLAVRKGEDGLPMITVLHGVVDSFHDDGHQPYKSTKMGTKSLSPKRVTTASIASEARKCSSSVDNSNDMGSIFHDLKMRRSQAYLDKLKQQRWEEEKRSTQNIHKTVNDIYHKRKTDNFLKSTLNIQSYLCDNFMGIAAQHHDGEEVKGPVDKSTRKSRSPAQKSVKISRQDGEEEADEDNVNGDDINGDASEKTVSPVKMSFIAGHIETYSSDEEGEEELRRLEEWKHEQKESTRLQILESLGLKDGESVLKSQSVLRSLGLKSNEGLDLKSLQGPNSEGLQSLQGSEVLKSLQGWKSIGGLQSIAGLKSFRVDLRSSMKKTISAVSGRSSEAKSVRLGKFDSDSESGSDSSEIIGYNGIVSLRQKVHEALNQTSVSVGDVTKYIQLDPVTGEMVLMDEPRIQSSELVQESLKDSELAKAEQAEEQPNLDELELLSIPSSDNESLLEALQPDESTKLEYRRGREELKNVGLSIMSVQELVAKADSTTSTTNLVGRASRDSLSGGLRLDHAETPEDPGLEDIGGLGDSLQSVALQGSNVRRQTTLCVRKSFAANSKYARTLTLESLLENENEDDDHEVTSGVSRRLSLGRASQAGEGLMSIAAGRTSIAASMASTYGGKGVLAGGAARGARLSRAASRSLALFDSANDMGKSSMSANSKIQSRVSRFNADAPLAPVKGSPKKLESLPDLTKGMKMKVPKSARVAGRVAEEIVEVVEFIEEPALDENGEMIEPGAEPKVRIEERSLGHILTLDPKEIGATYKTDLLGIVCLLPIPHKPKNIRKIMRNTNGSMGIGQFVSGMLDNIEEEEEEKRVEEKSELGKAIFILDNESIKQIRGRCLPEGTTERLEDKEELDDFVDVVLEYLDLQASTMVNAMYKPQPQVPDPQVREMSDSVTVAMSAGGYSNLGGDAGQGADSPAHPVEGTAVSAAASRRKTPLDHLKQIEAEILKMTLEQRKDINYNREQRVIEKNTLEQMHSIAVFHEDDVKDEKFEILNAHGKVERQGKIQTITEAIVRPMSIKDRTTTLATMESTHGPETPLSLFRKTMRLSLLDKATEGCTDTVENRLSKSGFKRGSLRTYGAGKTNINSAEAGKQVSSPTGATKRISRKRASQKVTETNYRNSLASVVQSGSIIEDDFRNPSESGFNSDLSRLQKQRSLEDLYEDQGFEDQQIAIERRYLVEQITDLIDNAEVQKQVQVATVLQNMSKLLTKAERQLLQKEEREKSEEELKKWLEKEERLNKDDTSTIKPDEDFEKQDNDEKDADKDDYDLKLNESEISSEPRRTLRFDDKKLSDRDGKSIPQPKKKPRSIRGIIPANPKTGRIGAVILGSSENETVHPLVADTDDLDLEPVTNHADDDSFTKTTSGMKGASVTRASVAAGLVLYNTDGKPEHAHLNEKNLFNPHPSEKIPTEELENLAKHHSTIKEMENLSPRDRTNLLLEVSEASIWDGSRIGSTNVFDSPGSSPKSFDKRLVRIDKDDTAWMNTVKVEIDLPGTLERIPYDAATDGKNVYLTPSDALRRTSGSDVLRRKIVSENVNNVVAGAISGSVSSAAGHKSLRQVAAISPVVTFNSLPLCDDDRQSDRDPPSMTQSDAKYDVKSAKSDANPKEPDVSTPSVEKSTPETIENVSKNTMNLHGTYQSVEPQPEDDSKHNITTEQCPSFPTQIQILSERRITPGVTVMTTCNVAKEGETRIATEEGGLQGSMVMHQQDGLHRQDVSFVPYDALMASEGGLLQLEDAPISTEKDVLLNPGVYVDGHRVINKEIIDRIEEGQLEEQRGKSVERSLEKTDENVEMVRVPSPDHQAKPPLTTSTPVKFQGVFDRLIRKHEASANLERAKQQAVIENPTIDPAAITHASIIPIGNAMMIDNAAPERSCARQQIDQMLQQRILRETAMVRNRQIFEKRNSARDGTAAFLNTTPRFKNSQSKKSPNVNDKLAEVFANPGAFTSNATAVAMFNNYSAGLPGGGGAGQLQGVTGIPTQQRPVYNPAAAARFNSRFTEIPGAVDQMRTMVAERCNLAQQLTELQQQGMVSTPAATRISLKHAQTRSQSRVDTGFTQYESMRKHGRKKSIPSQNLPMNMMCNPQGHAESSRISQIQNAAGQIPSVGQQSAASSQKQRIAPGIPSGDAERNMAVDEVLQSGPSMQGAAIQQGAAAGDPEDQQTKPSFFVPNVLLAKTKQAKSPILPTERRITSGSGSPRRGSFDAGYYASRPAYGAGHLNRTRRVGNATPQMSTRITSMTGRSGDIGRASLVSSEAGRVSEYQNIRSLPPALQPRSSLIPRSSPASVLASAGFEEPMKNARLSAELQIQHDALLQSRREPQMRDADDMVKYKQQRNSRVSIAEECQEEDTDSERKGVSKLMCEHIGHSAEGTLPKKKIKPGRKCSETTKNVIVTSDRHNTTPSSALKHIPRTVINLASPVREQSPAAVGAAAHGTSWDRSPGRISTRSKPSPGARMTSRRSLNRTWRPTDARSRGASPSPKMALERIHPLERKSVEGPHHGSEIDLVQHEGRAIAVQHNIADRMHQTVIEKSIQKASKSPKSAREKSIERSQDRMIDIRLQSQKKDSEANARVVNFTDASFADEQSFGINKNVQSNGPSGPSPRLSKTSKPDSKTSQIKPEIGSLILKTSKPDSNHANEGNRDSDDDYVVRVRSESPDDSVETTRRKVRTSAAMRTRANRFSQKK